MFGIEHLEIQCIMIYQMYGHVPYKQIQDVIIKRSISMVSLF